MNLSVTMGLLLD